MKIDWANYRSKCIYLAWPPPPVDQCAWPGTSPHHTEPLSWPPPQTAGNRDSTSLRHIPKDRVNGRGHRTCNTNHMVKGEGKLTFDYIQEILTTLKNPKSKAVFIFTYMLSFKMLLRLRGLHEEVRKKQTAYAMHSRWCTGQQITKSI